MAGIKSESDIVEETNELMQKRGITDRTKYIDYLVEQKEVKREKSEARMKEAELEKVVLEKMKKGEL